MLDYQIFFVKGDTYTLEVKIKTPITDVKRVRFTVINSKKEQLVQKTLDDGISYQDNVILVTLKPKDTINLIADEHYLYDLQIDYGEHDCKTILRGTLIAGWKATESEV